MKKNLTLLLALGGALAWNYASGQASVSAKQDSKAQIKRIPLMPLDEKVENSTVQKEKIEAHSNTQGKQPNTNELFLKKKESTLIAPKQEIDTERPK